MSSYAGNQETKISLKKYQGLRPTMFSALESKQIVSFGHIYSRSTNWSYAFNRDTLDVPNERAGYYGRNCSSCFSGAGRFVWRKKLLIDLSSVLHILTIEVVDPLGNKIYMVSDKFDSPKCPTRYRSMRKHWRKTMYNLIDQNVKIVKVSHNFLQQFKVQYNYAPSVYQVQNLKLSILRQVKTEVLHG